VLDLIKPYFGPIALICLDKGLNATGVQVNDFWSGAMLAFAAFWFSLALASHTALVKRFPGIKDWLPFIDPAGGIRAGPKELTDKHISGKTVWITDFAVDGLLLDRSFDDCHILGPAVLYVPWNSLIGYNAIWWPPGRDISCIFVTVDDLAYRQGVILGTNCIFRKCDFRNISFLVRKEDREKFISRLAPMKRAPDTPDLTKLKV
jgi:hypothetical protein